MGLYDDGCLFPWLAVCPFSTAKRFLAMGHYTETFPPKFVDRLIRFNPFAKFAPGSIC